MKDLQVMKWVDLILTIEFDNTVNDFLINLGNIYNPYNKAEIKLKAITNKIMYASQGKIHTVLIYINKYVTI